MSVYSEGKYQNRTTVPKIYIHKGIIVSSNTQHPSTPYARPLDQSRATARSQGKNRVLPQVEAPQVGTPYRRELYGSEIVTNANPFEERVSQPVHAPVKRVNPPAPSSGQGMIDIASLRGKVVNASINLGYGSIDNIQWGMNTSGQLTEADGMIYVKGCNMPHYQTWDSKRRVYVSPNGQHFLRIKYIQ